MVILRGEICFVPAHIVKKSRPAIHFRMTITIKSPTKTSGKHQREKVKFSFKDDFKNTRNWMVTFADSLGLKVHCSFDWWLLKPECHRTEFISFDCFVPVYVCSYSFNIEIQGMLPVWSASRKIRL